MTLAEQIVNCQYILHCAIADYCRLTGHYEEFGVLTTVVNDLTGKLLRIIEGSNAQVAIPPHAPA